MTCLERDEEDAEIKDNGDQKLARKLKEEIKRYKYIGETNRSVYERGWEHQNDMATLNTSSHFLKHILDKHPDKNTSEIKFGIKVLQYTRSSFERQILESVLIQEHRHHHLLNSRSEYNRCAVPRLTAKIGDSHYKKYEEEVEQEKEKESELIARIRQMRKDKNKERNVDRRKGQPANKRRKVEDGFVEEGKPGTQEYKSRGEKRKDEVLPEEIEPDMVESPAKRTRTKQTDIRTLLVSNLTNIA